MFLFHFPFLKIYFSSYSRSIATERNYKLNVGLSLYLSALTETISKLKRILCHLREYLTSLYLIPYFY